MPDITDLLNPAWTFAITVGDWWIAVAVAVILGFCAGRLRRD